jgi:anaerobic selenocysteine-containing dehydrogenase
VPWEEWVGDYAKIRDAIEMTYPETFKNFNKRMFQPGGFPRPLPARERKWVTPNGKANFITPKRLFPDFDVNGSAATDLLHLTTLRSNDQFNTTVYGYSDRFRGIEGTRHVLFMNPADMERLGFREDDAVSLVTAIHREKERSVSGLRVVAYGIPEGCCAAYYPEANPLFPLDHHDPKAKTPGYKLLPVHVRRAAELAKD